MFDVEPLIGCLKRELFIILISIKQIAFQIQIFSNIRLSHTDQYQNPPKRYLYQILASFLMCHSTEVLNKNKVGTRYNATYEVGTIILEDYISDIIGGHSWNGPRLAQEQHLTQLLFISYNQFPFLLSTMALNPNPNNANTNNTHNSKSIFQQANCFLLPETEMLDFFDYLTGQKIQLPAQLSYAEESTVTFHFAAPLPKPSLYKYRRPQEKSKEFRAIRLKEIPSKDH